MRPLGSVAPGTLRGTGDDGSGRNFSGRSPPQGISFYLSISHNDSPVFSSTSGPHTTFSQLD